ncbi:MAG: mechanosensitive ion channel [Candidatus Eisenbacteria bacterium]|nr:mechanosensitive ion channel [Candidatus Latescibacterota bacterium]MBD3301513.1 mechanosensitive ion channel [Candidatus Eisenbacteria bacterium]
MNIDFQAHLQDLGRWVLTGGIKIVIIIILALIALRVAKGLTRRAFSSVSKRGADPEFSKRADTLSSTVGNILTVVVMTIALMMILREIGIDIGPILAGAGILGLAIGFGAQNLVQDLISGFYILLDDQIRVGDVVQIAGKGGLVERVTLRMTVIRDLAGSVHYVRNGQIEVVTNMTKDFSMYVFDVGVAYREDTDEVVAALKEVDEDLRNDPDIKDSILAPLEIMGVDKFADSAVVIKARIKTKPIKQWAIGREFNRRMKKTFDRKGIEIPFPHVTVYAGEPKEGPPPAFLVSKSGSEGPGEERGL